MAARSAIFCACVFICSRDKKKRIWQKSLRHVASGSFKKTRRGRWMAAVGHTFWQLLHAAAAAAVLLALLLAQGGYGALVVRAAKAPTSGGVLDIEGTDLVADVEPVAIDGLVDKLNCTAVTFVSSTSIIATCPNLPPGTGIPFLTLQLNISGTLQSFASVFTYKRLRFLRACTHTHSLFLLSPPVLFSPPFFFLKQQTKTRHGAQHRISTRLTQSRCQQKAATSRSTGQTLGQQLTNCL